MLKLVTAAQQLYIKIMGNWRPHVWLVVLFTQGLLINPSAWAQDGFHDFIGGDVHVPSILPLEGFTGTTANPTDLANLQGCGGVDYSTYTGALFNMPQEYTRFQRDLNSLLGKQLLTFNYSLPQTSALFAQLNTMGTERFAQFQRACNVSDLQQKAKNEYLKACLVAEIPRREADLVDKISRQNVAIAASVPPADLPDGTTSPRPQRIELEERRRMAYAQAVEVCNLQYSQENSALRTATNTEIAVKMRSGELVTNRLRQILCPASPDLAAGNVSPCWPLLLLPRVRVCAAEELGCGAGGYYGVRTPMVEVQQVLDAILTVMLKNVQPNIIDRFNRELSDKGVEDAGQKIAADGATQKLNSTEITPPPPPTEKILANLQRVLNCPTFDMLRPMSTYVEELNQVLRKYSSAPIGPVAPITIGTVDTAAFSSVVDAMNLAASGFAEDINQLPGALQIALGCTINRAVPMFDPQVTYALNQCTVKDRYAFYQVSANLAAMQATRELYNFTLSQLRQVSFRLLNPEDDSNFPGKELAEKQHAAVREVMIPAMENALKSLDEMASAKGKFGQRVGEIYANRSGCVYGTSAQ
jgi:hypothetical protein